VAAVGASLVHYNEIKSDAQTVSYFMFQVVCAPFVKKGLVTYVSLCTYLLYMYVTGLFICDPTSLGTGDGS